MADQRRRIVLIAAAASLVLAVLLWWFVQKRKVDAPAAADEQIAMAEPLPGIVDGTAARPPELDLDGAPKAAISGTVSDLDGNPIPDAQVCAVSETDDRQGIEDHDPHCARSDPKGRYAIDGLLPIPTEVSASAATFKPSRWTRYEAGLERSQVRLRAGQTREGIDITLEPGGVLVRGVVKDIAGGVIAGAPVVLTRLNASDSEGSAYTVSKDDGTFEQWAAPGELAAIAQVEGYAMGWVIGVAPGQFLELFLTPESVLIGRVVLADSGEPVADAVVSPGGRNLPGQATSARTDADGRFRIDRLQPGTYKPSAEGDTLYGQAAEQVHLGLGESSEEVVIRVHPAVLVEGRVTIAGSDRPCTHGSVRLQGLRGDSKYQKLDDEGRVRLRGVLSGTYRVFVYCFGHVGEESYPDLVVEQSNLVGLEWEVREALAIRGIVVDEQGEPVGSVRVRAGAVVDPEAPRAQTTSAGSQSRADGSFELAGLVPGRYEVSISDWERPRPPEPTAVELDGADVDGVRLVLPASGSIRGRIVDAAGKPVSAALISAEALDAQGFGRSRSNDAGEFTVENLRPGSTRVTASDGATFGAGMVMRKPGTSDDDIQGEVVEVVANDTVEVTLVVESRDGRITGVVEDESGGPVADAFVDVDRMSERAGASAASARRSIRWSWGSEPVLTDADGRFELTKLADGKFIIRANRKGGGEAVLEDVSVGSHVELIVASTGELSGTVALEDGTTPERFTIMIEDEAQVVSMSDSYFRTDGVWRLTEVPAGSYEIKASAAEGSVTLEAPIELGEGEVRDGIELVLSSRVTLRGRIVDIDTGEPVAGMYVSGGDGRRSSKDERRYISDADGRFELENVPIGAITLTAWNSASGSHGKYGWFWQPLVVAAEPAVQDIGEIEVVARRVKPNEEPGELGFRIAESDPSVEPEDWRAHVVSVRPDGPAAAAGLATGDVIEKVDGHAVSGNSSRYYTLTRVPVGATLRLELAGGKTVEITADPRD